MQDNQQFEQLMLQYEQLKNGAEDILQMINEEDFDGAIGMLKSRESVFLDCKCIRNFLEMNAEQEAQLNKILDEVRELELRNMKILSQRMDEVKQELTKTQKVEKIHNAYEHGAAQSGSIINIKE